jgi:hypothetical protein
MMAMTDPDPVRAAFLRLIRAASGSRLDDLAVVAGLPRREAGESEDSLRQRMAAGLDAERTARCSFCRRHDWEVGRLVASADGSAFLCDECEAAAHAVMIATPASATLGHPPVVRKPIRIDWRKLPHHQTHGPR